MTTLSLPQQKGYVCNKSVQTHTLNKHTFSKSPACKVKTVTDTTVMSLCPLLQTQGTILTPVEYVATRHINTNSNNKTSETCTLVYAVSILLSAVQHLI